MGKKKVIMTLEEAVETFMEKHYDNLPKPRSPWLRKFKLHYNKDSELDKTGIERKIKLITEYGQFASADFLLKEITIIAEIDQEEKPK